MKLERVLGMAAIVALLGGCAGQPPFRTLFAPELASGCEAIYGEGYTDPKDENLADAQKRIDAALETEPGKRCWMRTSEKHEAFDLFTVEFDDQGWWAHEFDWGSRDSRATALWNYLQSQAADRQPLSIVVYTHGWHHSAYPSDTNVIAFRQLLRGFAALEHQLCVDAAAQPRHASGACGAAGKNASYWNKGRRVVGIYVGWRGDSVVGPGIEHSSIWDRKLAAEKVALGSAQELFAMLHQYYLEHGCHSEGGDTQCGTRSDVRMITIGHSFGGLITHRALAPRLMTAIVETHRDFDAPKLPYAYSYGDLTVLINPAFEGSRFEALARAAAQRRYEDGTNGGRKAQLPILVIAQSEGDVATHTFFPLFRQATTLFEHTEDAQREVNVHAVGWIDRYITHDLTQDGDEVCPTWPTDSQDPVVKLKTHVKAEMELMQGFREHGYTALTREFRLCDRLHVKPAPTRFAGTGMPAETYSPLWVLRTGKKVIENHNDFLNPEFQVFVRQVYQAILREKDALQQRGIERAIRACTARMPACDCDSFVGRGSGNGCTPVRTSP